MKTFWQNKNVLVTGAGGFIGSHLVERLVDQGAHVRAFVRYNSKGEVGHLSALGFEALSKLDIIAGDLRDLTAVTSAMNDIDIVFHLGALIAIPYSYKHPANVVDSNIIGTMNILLAARETKVKRIVHTSTSEVYGTAMRVPIDESHPLQGQSPYSASKIAADKLAESFYRSFDLPVVTLRPFNTYGPRQSTRAVIPTIITQALTQDEIYLGNLDATRDLTYVSDTVEGFLRAGEVHGIEGGTFNLGVGREVKIGELAQEIIALINRQVYIRIDTTRLRPAKSEVERLLSDNRLAKEKLAWSPRVGLREGLLKTIEWISANLSLYRPSIYQL
jgi:NAD dependent epimerase/dehydratase